MTRTARAAVPILALLALLIIMAGIPIALVLLVGWPLPSPLPSSAELGDVVSGRTPVPADYLISGLAVVMWVLWVQVAWATAVETVAAVRGRLARQTMVLPGIQTAIGRLVAAAALLTTSLSARPVLAGPLADVAVVDGGLDGAAFSGMAGTGAVGAGRSATALAEAGTSTVTARQGQEAESRPQAYITQPGDTWWGIAEQSLGAGTRWKEVRGMNLGRTMEDGTTITNSTDMLRPNWRLLMPASATSPAAAVGSASEVDVREVVVERGDSIWQIAEDDLGDGFPDPVVADHVDAIADVNVDALGGNPDLIHPGQLLMLPPTPIAPAPAPDGSGNGATDDGGAGEVQVNPTVDTVDTVDADDTAHSDDASSTATATATATEPEPEPEPDADGEDPADPGPDPQPTGETERSAGPILTDTDSSPQTGTDTSTETEPAAAVGSDGTTETVSPLAGARAESTGVDPAAAEMEESPSGSDEESSAAEFDTDGRSGDHRRPREAVVLEVGADVDEAAVAVPPTADLSTGGRVVTNLPGIGVAPADGAVPITVEPTSTVPEQSTPSSDEYAADLAAADDLGTAEGLATDSSRAPIYAGLAGLTLVGAYLHRARGRRRENVMRSRHAGRRPAKPKQATRSVARRFAAAAEAEHPEFVNVGLRALGRLMQKTAHHRLPKIAGVWVTHNRMVVTFTADSPRPEPPAPFTEFVDGSGWSLRRIDFDEARSIAEGANGPLPLLTSLGTTSALDLALTTSSRTPADAYGMGTSLLFAVDLEPGRVISIEAGDESTTIEAMTAMALELATSETADQAEIVCVGFGHRLASLERVVVVEDVAQIHSDLETITSRAVYAESDASPFATRVGNGAADTWNPVVVFHADSSDPDTGTLIELADRTEGGVTAVCGYATGTGWTFRIDGDRIVCPDLPGELAGHEFVRPRLDDADQIADFLDESMEDEPIDEDFWVPLDDIPGFLDADGSTDRQTAGPGEDGANSDAEGGFDDQDDSWRPMRTVTDDHAGASERDRSSRSDEVDRAAGPVGHLPPDAPTSGMPAGTPAEYLAELKRREQAESEGDADAIGQTEDGWVDWPDPDSWPPAPEGEERTDPDTVDDQAADTGPAGLRHSTELPTPAADRAGKTSRSAASIQSVRAVVPPPRAPRRATEDETGPQEIRLESPKGAESPSEQSSDPERATRVDDVRISVLGNFTIEGHHLGDRKKPWKYTKTPELILYLLMHPNGASQDLLMEELFPEQPPNRPRLNQLVSDARIKALGQDSTGDFYLPHASPTEPFYRLAPTVGFDLRDFAVHCSRAKTAADIDDEESAWIEALKLVKGRPFTLPHDGYEWAVAEIEATIIKVEEAAVALTDLAFEKGDFELAVWASKKGLLTGTGYYELLVKRGKAALLLQDAEEIVRAFADLQSSLEHGGAPEEGEPDLSSHPELENVYNQLSSGGRKRTSLDSR